MNRRRKFGIGGCVILLFSGIVLGGLANVDGRVTSQDRKAILRIIGNPDACQQISTFEGQIHCVQAVQKAHLAFSDDLRCPKTFYGQEPNDFLERGHGCCFDRSRLIEKTLKIYGFETRHVAIHMLNMVFPFGYLEPGIRSHAFSEVLTNNGWMIVDSRSTFLGWDEKTQVVSTKQLREQFENNPGLFEVSYTDAPADFRSEYNVAIGLYSRHGKFYPPFVPVPDINWKEFLHNFWE